MRPHRQQPTRLPHPWDSPSKNTGVGYHLLPPFKIPYICVNILYWCYSFFLSFFFYSFLNFYLFIFYFFNFTILYWFCHISTWICHRYTCVPHPEPSSLLPPWTILLGHPNAPAPSIQHRALNLDWRLVSYMILYMFQCHFPKSSHPLPLPQSPQMYRCSIHLYWCIEQPLLLSCIQGYCYHLSKFHIYALVYCIGAFLSDLLHSV